MSDFDAGNADGGGRADSGNGTDGGNRADARDDAVPRDEADTEPRVETVHARGHENVTGDHQSTVELTTDDWLTPAGDCIVGVEADTTPTEFDDAFISVCQSASATITAKFAVETDNGTLTDTITARGDPELTFENDRSLVGRTSEYVDDRTVFVGADGAAADLDRELIDALAEGAELTLTLRVEA